MELLACWLEYIGFRSWRICSCDESIWFGNGGQRYIFLCPLCCRHIRNCLSGGRDVLRQWRYGRYLYSLQKYWNYRDGYRCRWYPVDRRDTQIYMAAMVIV